MEPDDESVTCAYEAHQDRPETWHGNTADDWQLDTDSWTCNHIVRSELIDEETDGQFCVFHTDPADIPEEINEAKEFIHAINEQSSSGDEADAKEKKEFVGATFGAFEIERGTIIDAGDEYPIHLSHALFQNGLSARNVTFSHEILAHSTKFSGDNHVSFHDAEFSGDGGVSFSGTDFNGNGGVFFSGAKFSGDGGVKFSDVKFSGGSVWFDSAEFSGDGSILFSGAEFSVHGSVLFSDAKFSSDGDVWFSDAKFSGDGGVWFSNAKFSGDGRVSFPGTKFNNDGGVSFSGARFSSDGRVTFYSAEFSSNVSFANVNLTNCNLHIDSMAEMNLKRADFSGVNLSGVDFSDSQLEFAVFSRSVLYDSNFSGAKLDGASFGNAQVNESTKFVGIEPNSEERETVFYDPEHLQRADMPLIRLKSAISRYLPQRPVWSHDPRSSPPAEPKNPQVNQVQDTEQKKESDGGEVKDEVETGSEDTDKTSDEEKDWQLEYLQKAARTYHTIEKVGGENSLPDLQTVGFIRRQEMHRYRYAEQAVTSSNGSAGYWGKWLRASVARLTLLYGESPWRVIGVALSVILTAALLYPLGGFRYAGGNIVQAESLREYLLILPDSLYFSTLTFTTLGFGDFQPYTWGRWLATMETALGATLIALLVFVLGRRAAR